MLIFKFGGASLNSELRLKQVGAIVQKYSEEALVILVSAMGKTTNRLEKILDAAREENDFSVLLLALEEDHKSLLKDLNLYDNVCLTEIDELFDALSERLREQNYSYDEQYDRVVCFGELLSSTIVHSYLRSIGLDGEMHSAHDFIITDAVHRDAKVLWDETKANLSKLSIVKGSYILLEGFIGSSTDGNPTTLGREGSDYTASIIAYCLEADSVHIWKDVDGVFSADPNIFPDAILIPKMSYREAIEMSYYGAKVIHPKTIKPLENAGIPLYVRPFSQVEKEGTIISSVDVQFYPPIVVQESDQVLLRINPADLSFVAVNHLAELFGLFDTYRVKVNMMKNTAISFLVCLKYDGKRTEDCIAAIAELFQIDRHDRLELMTIRHFNDGILNRLTSGRKVWFREVYADTVQLVLDPI